MVQTERGDGFEHAFVGSVPLALANREQAVEWLLERSHRRDGRGEAVRLSNAWCIALADRDPEYRDVMKSSGTNFADGTPVALILRAKRRAGAGRVRGPSLFADSLDHGRRFGVRHFFLGTTDETLSKLVEAVRLRYEGVVIAGIYAPPFGPLSEEFYANALSAIGPTNADIVWVALGTPKQDFAATALANATGLTVVAVGAAFDFVAGTLREAPLWIGNLGLEWLFRLFSEPRRLWRRYLIGNVQFMRASIAPPK